MTTSAQSSTYDGEVTIKEQMKALQRDVDAKTAVFVPPRELSRNDASVSGLVHEHDRLQKAWNSG